MRSICCRSPLWQRFSHANHHVQLPIRIWRQQIHTSKANRSSSSPPSDFKALGDMPVRLVKVSRRHGPGLIILALIPITAFALGTWQVFRLEWKTDMLRKFEDRLVRDPLPLPLVVDEDAIPEFEYRRIEARGRWRHDLEMLIGPRIRDGKNGYLVVTPLERSDGRGGLTRVLVCRGWIAKAFAKPKKRDPAATPQGEVVVEGLLREAWKKNMFTPDNRPDIGEWYFPDVKEMAQHTDSQAVWVEQTMEPDLIEAFDREDKGIPIGRAAEVNIRNNHAQYIFTWYSLSLATSIMFWMVVKKPPTGVAAKVRHSKDWA